MPPGPDEQLLHGTWVHAHEEDTQGRRVFRPSSHPLPPARGRTVYQFAPGGKLARVGPGPTDRSVSDAGSWSLDSQGRLTIAPAGGAPETTQIESLTPDRLVLKAL